MEANYRASALNTVRKHGSLDHVDERIRFGQALDIVEGIIHQRVGNDSKVHSRCSGAWNDMYILWKEPHRRNTIEAIIRNSRLDMLNLRWLLAF